MVLDSTKAKAIRKAYKANASINALASKYGVHPSTIYRVLTNELHPDPEYMTKEQEKLVAFVTAKLVEQYRLKPIKDEGDDDE